jgi:Family of unknown function (DUF5329)
MKIGYLKTQIVTVVHIALTAAFLLLASHGYGGEVARLDATVQHLIAIVAQSGLTFIRNDVRYTGKEASEHMQKKYVHFRDKIKAPEDFIELCASRSLLSGRPYLVINEKGEKISASEWLRTELAMYRTSVAGESH